MFRIEKRELKHQRKPNKHYSLKTLPTMLTIRARFLLSPHELVVQSGQAQNIHENERKDSLRNDAGNFVQTQTQTQTQNTPKTQTNTITI